MDAKTLAAEIGTDPKTLRRFVRSHLRAIGAETPGLGGRYVFDEDDVEAVRDAFIAWRRGARTISVRFVGGDDEDDES